MNTALVRSLASATTQTSTSMSTSLTTPYTSLSSSLTPSPLSPLPPSASWPPPSSPIPSFPPSFSFPSPLLLAAIESPSPLSDTLTATITLVAASSASTYESAPPTYAPDPPDTTTRQWRPSPVYTFLATLLLLLAVSAAIVTRSFILRRRNRRLIEEAIRNGTWNPGMMDGGVGGNGPLGHAGPRVDLSKKPRMWETYLGGDGSGLSGYVYGYEKGVYGGERGYLTGEKGGAVGGEMKEWDGIKPVSAGYVAVPKGKTAKPVVGPLGIPPGVNDGHTATNHSRQGILSSVGTFVADLFRPPRPGSVPQATTAGAGQQEDEEVEAALTPEGERTVRVAVLIAMPRPPSGHRQSGSSSSDASTSSLRSASPAATSGAAAAAAATIVTTHPLLAAPVLLTAGQSQVEGDGEETPLPVLEIGVAEVVVVDSEVELRPRMSGDTEEEFRKGGDAGSERRSSVSVER